MPETKNRTAGVASVEQVHTPYEAPSPGKDPADYVLGEDERYALSTGGYHTSMRVRVTEAPLSVYARCAQCGEELGMCTRMMPYEWGLTVIVDPHHQCKREASE